MLAHKTIILGPIYFKPSKTFIYGNGDFREAMKEIVIEIKIEPN